jgi:hypothetical protein
VLSTQREGEQLLVGPPAVDGTRRENEAALREAEPMLKTAEAALAALQTRAQDTNDWRLLVTMLQWGARQTRPQRRLQSQRYPWLITAAKREEWVREFKTLIDDILAADPASGVSSWAARRKARGHGAANASSSRCLPGTPPASAPGNALGSATPGRTHLHGPTSRQ